MKQKILIGSIMVVVLLILVTVDPVVGKATSDPERVELEVEFYGLGQKHTVKLTPQEVEELDHLFGTLEEELSEVETKQETEEIFRKAVVALDNNDLLSQRTVNQITRYITPEIKI